VLVVIPEIYSIGSASALSKATKPEVVPDVPTIVFPKLFPITFGFKQSSRTIQVERSLEVLRD